MRTRLHKQARKNTCAVAALRTVLDVQLGIKVPEAALEAHGTDAHMPIVREGTGTANLRAMVAGVNRTHNTGRRWRLRVAAHGSLADLERELAAGRVPMVRVSAPGTGCGYHMVVVLAVSDTHVKVFDPDPSVDDTPQWVPIPVFLVEWIEEDATAWYAVLNADARR